MRIEYEPTHDILNIEFLKGVAIVDSVEVEGVIVDYSADRKIVSLEILDAGKRTTKNPLESIDLAIFKSES